MKFGFERLTKTGQGKIAELFDMQVGKGQTNSKFRQELVSTVDFYKNVQQNATQIENQKLKIDLTKSYYKVTSYDEALIQNMEKRGLKIKRETIGTLKLGCDLFNSNIENIPRTSIDTDGNVWELVG